MKLMHSLPQQIIITHTNNPHLKPCCKNEKQHISKTQHQLGEKKDNEMVATVSGR